MKSHGRGFFRRYQVALRGHIKAGSRAIPDSVQALGRAALAARIQTLELAKFHEHIMVVEFLPECPAGKRRSLILRAGRFFAAAIAPMETTQRTALDAGVRVRRLVETLSRRTVELAASNQALTIEIGHRMAAEESFRQNERRYSRLLSHSDRLQHQLRQLSRQVLSAQEDERRKISRELHDVIAQTLTSINVRLANLKSAAVANSKDLAEAITKTQRMVEESVHIVHQFARELRPAVLDDLGLIPALHSHLKDFTAETGIHVQLTAFKGVESLDIARRTALYRVAHEALNNVARHSKATRVDVTIRRTARGLCMRIVDNGISIRVRRASPGRHPKHLGLLGMKERIEMVGGEFSVESNKGRGTTIEARIPLGGTPSIHAAKSGPQPVKRSTLP